MHRSTTLAPSIDQHASTADNETHSAAPRPLHQIRGSLGNQAFGRAVEAALTVSNPGDRQEQEANRTAERVMRGERPPVSGSQSAESKSRDESQPLSPSLRGFFEPRFEHDLSHVRIHTGADTARAAHRTNSRAFTYGSDVVFGAGEYQPESPEGQRLIAHELAHVVQGDRHGVPTQIMRQPAGETPKTETGQTAPSAPPKASPEPVRPESKLDWKWSDVAMYPLLVDVFNDVIRKDLTSKEHQELALKGNEAAAYYVWAAAMGLPFAGLGGEKYEGGLSKGLTTWSNYVDALEPLSLNNSVMIDGISRIVGLRIDDYLASDLFKMRLKTRIASVVALGLVAQGGYSIYQAASGPGEVGELDPVDWTRHTGLATLLVGTIFKEHLKAPDFFDMGPLQMKTHPAFASTPFAGEAPPSGVKAEETSEVGAPKGGKEAKAAFTLNLPKIISLFADQGPKAADMGDLQKYRGWQTSLWFSYDKLNPTAAMTAAGRLPEEKIKGGVIFGGGGHLGMLEVGARYDGTAARELTSLMLNGGFGYSDKKGSVVNRLGFKATYLDWTEKDILAPRSETGEPYGGKSIRFTPFGKLEFELEKHKFDVGAALSFVSGTKEGVGVSDLRADLSYTYMGDSTEEKLPQFKIDLSGSFNRLDWNDPRSPKMFGLQARGSVGRAFGGVEVMTGAGAIPESRAGLIDKPEKVRVPTTLMVTGGWAF